MTAVAPVERLRVFYEGDPEAPHEPVGDLAIRGRRIFFQYAPSFLRRGLELSPLHLPVEPGVKEGDGRRFEGLFGLFDDSLPDGWGRLLLDRFVEQRGLRAATLSPLDRLAWVGASAIGALTYEPTYDLGGEPGPVDLHDLAAEARTVLEGKASDALPELLRLGGSPQGARPKALVLLGPDGETVVSGPKAQPGFVPCLVKYPARSDPSSVVGAIEFAYSQMARAAGIQMPPTHLLAARGQHHGYFAIQRFDIDDGRRVHVHTASGLLHAPPGLTFVSYDELLRLAWQLARDQRDVLELFRRAAFNVVAHNRDDHARNFTFQMDPEGQWALAPAYDLTFSEGPGGEHTMTVAGEGKRPTRDHLATLGRSASLKRPDIARVIDEVDSAVRQWPRIAADAGVPKSHRDRIAKRHLVSR